MNIDANVQKVLNALLKKWKLLVIFALIGSIAAYIYTANFTTLTYTSSLQFLTFAVDYEQDLEESSSASSSSQSNPSLSSQRTSETSKMNYAMKMMDTYIAVFNTNDFNQFVADTLNKTYGTDYSSGAIKNSITIKKVENSAILQFIITTTNPDLSYHIAQCLETCVPETMENTNRGLVHASVLDSPMKANAAESIGYSKKCLIGAAAGIILAGLYAVLKELLDVRIKGSNDLEDKYDIPVLGSIPKFELNQPKKGGRNNG